MSPVRTFNVLTLATILLLAGCFGLGDSAEAAEGDHDHTPNAAPVISLDLSAGLAIECGTITCEGSIYHAVVDPDGDVISSGWDTDLDGTIDVPVTSNRGYTDISIAFSDWEERGFTTIAFIAVDSNGAATAELITVFTDDYFYDDDDGGLDIFQFDDRDAAAEQTAAGGEDLIHVKMMQGSSLSWALLRVSIVVDGGTTNLCVELADADADGLKCTYVYVDDKNWDVSDEITISEGANADLCDGVAGFCEVEVTLTMKAVGDSDDRVIGMLTATAQ